MTRPVSSPRQMALSQTMQRNVFHKPREGAQKGQVLTHPPGRAAASPEAVEKADKTEQVEKAPEAVGPGRNDPCPCGSGKKSKKCCGA